MCVDEGVAQKTPVIKEGYNVLLRINSSMGL
jgi:hypothetical protein